MDFDADFAAPADWAHFYRAQGLQLVPSYMPNERPADWKRPIIKWREFETTKIPDTLFEQWYGLQGEHRLRPNMGIICGAASNGIFIVDLDTHKTPQAMIWWHGLIAVHNNGMQIETPRQTTGGGGKQMLFRAPEGWISPTCRTSIGVDIRGQGGFAVLAPALHASGSYYHWDEGLGPWDVDVCDAPDWLCEAIDALVEEHGGSRGNLTAPRVQTAATADYDAFGNQVDGREDTMTRVVWGAVLDLHRTAPIYPPEHESMAAMKAAYDVYVRKVRTRLAHLDNETGLETEGRGLSLFQEKWAAAMRQWDSKVREEAAKERPERPFAEAEIPGPEYVPPEGLFRFLDVRAIKSLPDPQWLVKGLAIEQALGFVYGPPGCLKTFICLDMALSFATQRAAWWGRDIERHGAVVYLSVEGQADLKFRIAAWEQKTGIKADAAPFYLVPETINFMKGDDVGRLLATVQEIASHLSTPIAAVFVDTVSRVLPGADENLQKDMTLFVSACDAVRQRFGCIVVGVHHTARAGNMRGSTVFPGAGDFILGVEREPGATEGKIIATKIKAAEDGWEQAFRVEEVALPFANTSLVVCPEEPSKAGGKASVGRAKAALTPNDRVVLDALRRAVAEGEKHPGLTAIPPDAQPARTELWRRTFYQTSAHEGETKRKAFGRAQERLVASGTVRVWGDWSWISTT